MSTTLQYNSIILEPISTIECLREDQYDGPTYLYTRTVLVARCIYNPSATSYVLQNGNPVARLGSAAPVTHEAVRHTLSQPRGTLIYKVGNRDVIRSPATGYDCDANLGPFPKVHAIKEVLGSKTFIVDFEIETFVNDCTTGNIVLSHRWEIEEDVAKPHYLAIRRVRGWAKLRADVMLHTGLTPDDYRAALMHPCPQGYQRENIHVKPGPDGNDLFYSFEDRQTPFAPNLSGDGVFIVDVEAFHTAEISKMPYDKALGQLASSVGRTLGAGARVIAELGPFGGWGAVGGVALVAGAGIIDFGVTAINLVPRQQHRLVIRARGNTNGTRQRLERFAVGMAFRRLSDVAGFSRQWGGLSFRCTHDLMNEFVEVQVEYTAGIERIFAGVASAANLANAALPGVPGVGFIGGLNSIVGQINQLNTEMMPLRETVEGFTTGGLAPQPRLPEGRNTRPASAFSLVAQALQSACGLPAAPSSTRRSTSSDETVVS